VWKRVGALAAVTVNVNRIGAQDFPNFLEFVTSKCCDVVFLQEADNLPPDIPCKGFVAFKSEGVEQ